MGLSIKLGLVCFEYSQMERGRIGGRPGGNNDGSSAINHVSQLNLVTLLNPVTLHFIQQSTVVCVLADFPYFSEVATNHGNIVKELFRIRCRKRHSIELVGMAESHIAFGNN